MPEDRRKTLCECGVGPYRETLPWPHTTPFIMQGKQGFAIQTLVVILVLNGILLAVLSFVSGAPATFGIGVVITLVLWFGVQTVGKRFIGEAATTEAPAVAAKAPAALPPQPQTPPAPPPPPSEASAIQILSILQRKGRLIDFLQEDLSAYQDAQIGAAVRQIHQDTKAALAEYVTLEPIYQEAEGSAITVAAGFDANAVRLTGNITGDPPFKGALRHRGWRVAKVDLPRQTPAQQKERIVAAAEVEVS